MPGDPDDDEVARYSIARAEELLSKHEADVNEDARAQVLVLRKLLYELRFGDPTQYLDVALIGVADAVNTGLKTAKLTFTMSSLNAA